MEALVSILSSSGVGTVIGGIFGFLNKREDRKIRQQEQEYELKRIQAQSHAETATADARAFEESQKTVGAVSGAVKSLVRPVITAALLYMVYNILMQLEALTGGIAQFPPEDAARLYRDIVLNIISLTATAVSWWFASRPANIPNLGQRPVKPS